MRLTILGLVAAFVVALAMSPQGASAQCGWADGLGCSSGGGHHKFYVDTGLSQGTQHLDCRYCSFGGCHPWCWEEEDEVDAVDLEMIAAQDDISRGDFPSLLERLGAVKKYAVFNEDRGAIQLMSCDGDMVVASMTVPLGTAPAILSELKQ